MNRIMGETTIEYPVPHNRELNSEIMIIDADTRLTHHPNIKETENTLNQHMIALFHLVRKSIIAIGQLGTGRIDDQRLTTRKPGPEVYRSRRDL